MKMKIPGITQAHKKCEKKMKERKQWTHKKDFIWEEGFHKELYNHGWMDWSEFWDIDSH